MTRTTVVKVTTVSLRNDSQYNGDCDNLSKIDDCITVERHSLYNGDWDNLSKGDDCFTVE